MSIGISQLFEDRESLADRGRLIPAIEALEAARQLTQIPDRRAWASYNLGVIRWHYLGDGVAARRDFLASVADFESQGYEHHPELKVIHANALENAMLCALSFDEFLSLAARLAEISPEARIVVNLVPNIRDGMERGVSWLDALFSFAVNYYNRNDPQHDAGRYGEGRSTHHLILANRCELRASRLKCKIALFELCALSMRMVSDLQIKRGADADISSPEEYLPILTSAIELADEYLAVNSGDSDISKVREQMELILTHTRQRWVELTRRSTIMALRNDPRAQPMKTEFQVCQRCGKVYARRDISGPEFVTGMMDMFDHPGLCMKCGGQVVWQSSPEIAPGFGPGCLPMLLFLSAFAGLAVTWL